MIKLTKGEVLYVLVGQEGESACVHNGVETREGLCSQMVRVRHTENWKQKFRNVLKEDLTSIQTSATK